MDLTEEVGKPLGNGNSPNPTLFQNPGILKSQRQNKECTKYFKFWKGKHLPKSICAYHHTKSKFLFQQTWWVLFLSTETSKIMGIFFLEASPPTWKVITWKVIAQWWRRYNKFTLLALPTHRFLLCKRSQLLTPVLLSEDQKCEDKGATIRKGKKYSLTFNFMLGVKKLLPQLLLTLVKSPEPSSVEASLDFACARKVVKKLRNFLNLQSSRNI
ncbi:hypothetical protein EGR_00538 [Echinococcus granulosus]|uniref:Uncharacterized protein n=1 Tax=Echinococcus granulosus TaxID=6210 RepID=W6UTH0_ECHGR|nr:hypothetical protein EGR_00538 [Echinococcus granulosus]EUB64588.1 hypothetical protein EGR_00538 [Echinococcus granulosus]